eukprot:1143363-Pelagomonas_calceolata.AAC.4
MVEDVVQYMEDDAMPGKGVYGKQSPCWTLTSSSALNHTTCVVSHLFADPTPRDGDIWRPKAIEMGGKKQFPYLVDPNTGKLQHSEILFCVVDSGQY